MPRTYAEKDCACGRDDCAGPFVPTAPAQKYNPECSSRIASERRERAGNGGSHDADATAQALEALRAAPPVDRERVEPEPEPEPGEEANAEDRAEPPPLVERYAALLIEHAAQDPSDELFDRIERVLGL